MFRSFLTVQRMFLTLALLVVFSLALAACGDAISTTQTGGGSLATPSPTTTTAPATSTPEKPPSTVGPTSAVTTAASQPNGSDQPASTPVIQFSATTLKVGDSMTVSGSGYPANTKLQVMLKRDGTSNFFGPFATPVTDGQGTFSAKVIFAGEGNGFDPGKYLVSVTTQDGRLGASAPVTLEALSAAKPKLVAGSGQVKIGDSVTLSGSGYPANAQLEIRGGVQNPGLIFVTVKTDAAGKFTKVINLDPVANDYFPGPYTFVAALQDNSLGAGVTDHSVGGG